MANVAATFLSQAFSALSVILLTPMLLKALGSADFGVYGLILNAIVWGGIMDLGMNMGMLRRMIHEKERTASLFSTLAVFYGGCLLLFCIAVMLLYLLHPTVFSGVTPAQAIMTILIMVQNVFATLLDVMIQSTQKIFKAKIIRIVKTIAEFSGILLVLQHHSLDNILQVMAMVNFLYILALLLFTRKEISFDFSWSAFRWSVLFDHGRYSIWYFLTTLSAVLVFNTQVFLIDRTVGAAMLAQYIVFMRFFEIIRTSVSNFTVVLFPTIVAREKTNDLQQLRELLKMAFVRTGLLLVLLFIMLVLAGQPLFQWWTKGQVPFDRELFLYFLLFTLLILVDNVSAIFLGALKLNRIPTILALLQGLLALGFTYMAVPLMGLQGAILSSLVALLLTNLIFNPLYLIKQINRPRTVEESETQGV